MAEKISALTKARQRLRKWREKQAEKKAAPHREVQQRMLGTLQRERPGTVYAGTANRKAVARRRAKNKVAKQSRKVNR
jgi:hypothetical protein